MKKGLYVHIPFCVQKCKYCDFVSFTSCNFEEYIDSLCREIDLWKGESIDTIFVGGGTPTVLPCELIDRLFSYIRKSFKVANDAEWTVEANPKTVDSEKLRLMRSLGVNRLSVGVQSFNNNELKRIGRIHTSYEAIETVKLISKYFENFNIDLISALPDQTPESFMNTLNTAISLNPTHISCYSLILEEGTPLYREHLFSPLNLPDEETEREMYYSMIAALERNGYNQYEISNFARTGFECKHNLKYWNCHDYIGVGVASHSLIDSVRNENTINLDEYNAGKFSNEKILLTESDKIAEYIIMTMRLRDGLNENDFSKRFSRDFYSENKKTVDRFISLGLMEKTKSGYRLSKEGISVSNSILCEFV